MMRPLPPFRLEAHFSRWEFNARYHMCASDMQSMPLSELLAMADPADREVWDALHLGYSPTWGLPALREAIAATYDSLSSSDVLCLAGAQEGIFAAMHALLTPQDHVITLVPNYQSAESIPLTICETSGVALDPDNNWELDLDELQDAIRPNTRMLCINFPNNPTGKVISQTTLDSLVQIARQHRLYLFSDEVFRGSERRPNLRLPQVADLYERGLSLGVMSKTYGLPGLRIGWLACRDPDILERVEKVKHYLSICNSTPSELLAVIALKARERILQRNLALLSQNLAMLDEFFADHADLFDWQAPDGSCIGYPRYLGAEGVETFVRELVEHAGVLLLPASIFQSALAPSPTDRFRIGYGRTGMKEGLAVIRNHLRSAKRTTAS